MPRKPLGKQLLRGALIALTLFACVLGALGWYVAQPSWRSTDFVETRHQASSETLQAHVLMLAETLAPRDFRHPENLDACADYLRQQFTQSGAQVEEQAFTLSGNTYRNIIARFNPGAGNKLIIGAHYDSYKTTPGADDNASGTAGLIELARLFGHQCPAREIELVAYTLEEPPWFATDHMGSAHHARMVAEQAQPIDGVLVLEMIGYFSDEPNSQAYPVPALKAFYPSRGNFIGVVGNLEQRPFTQAVKISMQSDPELPVYSINAPTNLTGIDFSDHRNYWPHGYQAVMITDTAFYRNPHYHEPTDTPDQLNYPLMAKVVDAVYRATFTLSL